MNAKVTGRKLTFSNALQRLNPDLFRVAGRVDAAKREPNPVTALGQDAPAKQASCCRVVVRIVSFTRRAQDSDNHQAGCKHLRDTISRTLGIDDGDERIRFEYAQVESLNQKGTLVLIHATP